MRRSRQLGQALVEFSLVIPIFLGMFLGVIDLGHAVWANDSLASAAREAARFAIVHGGSASNACPVGNPAPTAKTVTPSSSCPYPAPSKQAIVNVALSQAIAAGSNLSVTVCYGSGCTGSTDTGTDARGQPVTVTVTSQIPLVIPSLLQLGNVSLTGSSTMLVNY